MPAARLNVFPGFPPAAPKTPKEYGSLFPTFLRFYMNASTAPDRQGPAVPACPLRAPFLVPTGPRRACVPAGPRRSLPDPVGSAKIGGPPLPVPCSFVFLRPAALPGLFSLCKFWPPPSGLACPGRPAVVWGGSNPFGAELGGARCLTVRQKREENPGCSPKLPSKKKSARMFPPSVNLLPPARPAPRSFLFYRPFSCPRPLSWFRFWVPSPPPLF